MFRIPKEDDKHDARPYLILSIDAGALRVLFAVRLLRRLQQRYRRLLPNVQLVAGTSAGGVTALAIAAGLDLAVIEEMYIKASKVLFNTSAIGTMENVTARILGCPYTSENRKRPLADAFSLSDCVCLRDLQKSVIIPTVRLKSLAHNHLSSSSSDLCPGDVTANTDNQWDAQFFHNFMNSPDNSGRERIIDVAMRTTAAPTYYPIYQGYADGGLVCCNPSVQAIAQATDRVRGAGVSLSQIRMLSIGLGRAHDCIPEAKQQDDLDWGVWRWVRHSLLIDMMLEGAANVNHYAAQQLLGTSGYRRIDFKLPRRICADTHDPVFLEFLLTEADKVAGQIISGNSLCYAGIGKWIHDNFN